MKLHFRLISLISLLIGANIKALQSEPPQENNFVSINDNTEDAEAAKEDYEDQLKQDEATNVTTILDTFKEGKKESFSTRYLHTWIIHIYVRSIYLCTHTFFSFQKNTEK